MISLKYNNSNLEPMTIQNLINISIEKHPDRPALAFPSHEPLTYSMIGVKIKQTAKSLDIEGIKPGDTVAIIGESSPDWVCAYLGIIYRRAIAVPILPDFPAEDILNIFEHSESKIAFVSTKQMQKLQEAQLVPKIPIVILDSTGPSPGNTISYKDFIDKNKSGSAKENNDDKALEDEIAVITYTSGTTGLSKGVMLSNRNLLSAVLAADEWVNISQEDRFLSVHPTAHIFEGTLGLLMPLMHGASIYYLGKAPTADILKEVCASIKPTAMCLVPLIIEKIYNKRVKPKIRYNVLIMSLTKIHFFKKLIYRKAVKAIIGFFGGEINVIAFGGSPLDKEVEEFLLTGGFPYVYGYGLTEAAGITCGAPNGKGLPSSCGYPIHHMEFKITDIEPATGIGEILIKGPSVMHGYFKNDKLTNETLTDGGWLRTGDRGIVDKNGYLFIKGRSKNMFLSSSGENIYPEIIEEKLRKFPIVQEALARESKGTIEALVYPDPDVLAKKIEGKSETDREQIIGEILENIRIAVNKRLPHFYRIKKCVYQAEPFIKNATNKIKRFLYSGSRDIDQSTIN
jgi:long-chain acyl-CoA synthetase